MSNRLLIGNLSLEALESHLREVFSRAGLVQSVELVTDANTKKRKGFAFVTMASSAEAQKAIKLLDGTDINGRSIIVNPAEPAQQKPGLSFIARCVKLLKS